MALLKVQGQAFAVAVVGPVPLHIIFPPGMFEISQSDEAAQGSLDQRQHLAHLVEPVFPIWLLESACTSKAPKTDATKTVRTCHFCTLTFIEHAPDHYSSDRFYLAWILGRNLLAG